MKSANTPEKTLEKSYEVAQEDHDFVERMHGKYHQEIKDLDPGHENEWCPGCGNFGILMSLKKAIVNMEVAPEDFCIVSGIGQAGKMPHYVKVYGMETIHGRAIPVGTGVKLANKDLNVVVVGGDGDGYGVGMGHMIHAMRRNLNVTYLVHNNEIYGLTKGQTSPTTPKGTKTVSTPNGAIETAVNPIETALAGGATFIAKAFSGDIEGLAKLIQKGVEHKGFSIIDISQPCVTYNPSKNHKYFKDRVYPVEKLPSYNPASKIWAHAVANMDHGEKIPVGIIYHSDTDRETYIDDLPEDDDASLARQDISNIDVEGLLDKFE